MKTNIPANKNLKDIEPYMPGKASISIGKKKVIKLSANESPLEFSKKTSNKINKIKIDFIKYPDPVCNTLRLKIQNLYKIKSQNIIFGNGSDEIFFLIAYAYLNKSLNAIYSRHGFLIYPIAIKAAGAKGIFANETNLRTDVSKIIDKCNNKTRVCFIANPNNPTGTYITKSEVKKLREGLPKKCLLVIDAAYSEYVESSDYSDCINYAKKRNDIVVTHTFSKIFGIPSLRLGWAYCPEQVTNHLNKIRPAFNVNTYAQEVAKILIEDKDFIEKSVAHNTFWKNYLCKELKKLNIDFEKGVANFVLLKLETKLEANNLANFLEKNMILVRKLEKYKLSNCIRISIGKENENKKLIQIIKKWKIK